MNQIVVLIFLFFLKINNLFYASEIHYNNCKTLEEVIIRETEEITITNPSSYYELAQLYVSRGESYLLDRKYQKAIEDFKQADSYLENDIDPGQIIAFRTAFGKVVSYDNLGMKKETEEALQELKNIADHAGCNDCIDDRPCLGISISSSNCQDMIRLATKRIYYKNNCEEVFIGTGRAMEVIAGLAPNYAVKAVLIGIIEVLITRCLKCCKTGDFWKACVAPISRKWREWNNNKQNHLLPNSNNLPLYAKEAI